MIRYLAAMCLAVLLGCSPKTDNPADERVPQIALTAEEHDFVQSHRVVTWAVEENRPPNIYIDADGEAHGRAVAYLALISKMTGLVFKPVPVSGLRAGLQAVKSGQIDLITSVRPTTDRREYLGFTAPYADSGGVFVFGNSPKPNSPLKVAVQDGDSAGQYLEENFPNMSIVETGEYEEALVLLQRKSIDMILMNEGTADFMARKFGVRLHKVRTDFKYQATFGFKRDNLLLGSIMSKAILAISIDRKNKMNDAWKLELKDAMKADGRKP